MHTVKIGMLGAGTVGSGVWKILEKNADLLNQRLGMHLEITRVACQNPAAAESFGIPADRISTDPMEVATADDVEIVVELMGGLDPAYACCDAALRAGKHVVTANKHLLAHSGVELFNTAHEFDRELGFEASVAGSIPILRSLKEGFVADHIQGIYGIVNGTANFILSEMTDTGGDFESILTEAQALGYAERDPTFDIEGIDSVHKIAIVAMLAYGVRFDYRSIATEGITKITQADIDFARRFDYKIKLLAVARLVDDKLDIRVHPTMLPSTSQLAQVHGVFNAIYLEGDNVGAAMMYGRGAGSLPTASAVISDIASIARNRSGGRRVPDTGYVPENIREIELLPIDEVVSEYYLRMIALDQPGVLGQIATILGNFNISIASMIQEGRSDGNTVPIVLLTSEAKEGDLRNAIAEIEHLHTTPGSITYLRILTHLS